MPRLFFQEEYMDHDIEAVLSTHANGKEEERLSTSDVGPIEQARMQELILRFLPKKQSVVYDVGGAAGAYSFWMAARGHEVHLVDVVPLHIEQARRRASETGSPKLGLLNKSG
jgi:2-polyprenyl-3-methyl-5-hydroxy-6-metoxy-1,4-benzoquinol methylase